MTVVALTAFVTVKQKDGTVEHKFQNGKHTAVTGYAYLSFIYQGAAMNRSGDNLEASIILANNPLSMSYVKDFVEQKYYIQVETFLISNPLGLFHFAKILSIGSCNLIISLTDFFIDSNFFEFKINLSIKFDFSLFF